MARDITDKEIGELWRLYKPLAGQDSIADLAVALIRKLVHDSANAIPYGDWDNRITQPLRKYGISESEWYED
jgi:hypothetical protein